MSTGVSDQRMRGQGSQANGPKDQVNDHEDFDSWRNQSHQGYGAPSVASADPYLSSYYGTSFPYQPFDGAWSSSGGGGGDGSVAFLGGYGAPGPAHQDSYGIDGMFGPSGGFGNFGQPGFSGGYGFHGNGGGPGEYSAWGRKAGPYEEYYQRGTEQSVYQSTSSRLEETPGVKQVEQGMQGLALESQRDSGNKSGLGLPESGATTNTAGQPKKLTWASIASQPAKPQLTTKKKSMVPPPMVTPRTPSLDIGTWENKNGGNANPPNPPPANPPVSKPSGPPPTRPAMFHNPPRPLPPPQRSPNAPLPPMGPPPPAYPPPTVPPVMTPPTIPPPMMSAPPPAASLSPSANPVLEELQSKHNYNPKDFDLTAKNARFFVIKSYSEDDIHRSIKYEIWCSTEHGNKRLDAAFRERDSKGPVYLFFSVNGSGHFCGMAEMTSAVDMSATLSVWSQDKWRGQFTVKWIYVKDVPNAALRHIRLENNENKPVTNSRDTQEIPAEKGRQVLKIMHTYRHATSIFDDFTHYEKRQAEEDQRKSVVQTTQESHFEGSAPPPSRQDRDRDRDRDRERDRDRDRDRERERERDRDRDSYRGDRDREPRDRDQGRGRPGGGGSGGGGGYDYRDRDGYRERENRGHRDGYRDRERDRDFNRGGRGSRGRH